jgi:hypothetical protein
MTSPKSSLTGEQRKCRNRKLRNDSADCHARMQMPSPLNPLPPLRRRLSGHVPGSTQLDEIRGEIKLAAGFRQAKAETAWLWLGDVQMPVACAVGAFRPVQCVQMFTDNRMGQAHEDFASHHAEGKDALR